MVTSREILESTYRTGRMKKMRKSLYAILFIVCIVMIIFFSFITPNTGFDPLYLPFQVYFFIVAVMLLMANISSIFFKLFGLKWAKTDSEKFLLAKNYINKGIIMASAAILVMGVINFFTPLINEDIDTETTIVFEDQYNTTFVSQDIFAIPGVKKIMVTSEDDTPIPINIFILRERDFQNGQYEKRFNVADYESKDITRLIYKRSTFLPHGNYVIFMNGADQAVKVTYSIEREVSTSFVPYFTIFPIIFAAINAGWIGYLFPMKKRYQKKSIYE
jgi:hypothetical protein